ncbi:MAG: phosphate ABC transporter substrate-binding protein PstS family protein [Coriobacteriales bacterium]|jgi:phosphate transport system substrate-binding protein
MKQQLKAKSPRKAVKAIVAGAVAACMVASFGLVGCGGGSSSSSSSSSATASSASSSASTSGNSITAVGSTALQPLVEAAAEQYMNSNSGVQVTVQGGGSGQGITQIVSGAVQIGDSDVFAEDKVENESDLTKIKDNKVAVVGMGPVVNKDVDIDNIKMSDLKKIFMGKITNWKEVGGQDEKITVINRASGSGTRATFENAVFDGDTAPSDFTPQEQDSSGTVQKMVAETPGAISYLAFSYFDDSIKALSVDNVKPTSENVESNKWVIWSYEHMYTAADPDSTTQAFIDYMMSSDVQDSLVESNGYIPIKKMKVEVDASGKVTKL